MLDDIDIQKECLDDLDTPKNQSDFYTIIIDECKGKTVSKEVTDKFFERLKKIKNENISICPLMINE